MESVLMLLEVIDLVMNNWRVGQASFRTSDTCAILIVLGKKQCCVLLLSCHWFQNWGFSVYWKWTKRLSHGFYVILRRQFSILMLRQSKYLFQIVMEKQHQPSWLKSYNIFTLTKLPCWNELKQIYVLEIGILTQTFR